jgi:hypothetical protein
MSDLPVPNFSLWGIGSYMLFAVGVSAGFALFTEPMSRVETLIGNLRNGA